MSTETGSTETELAVDLRQMILALETAVDLVGMNDTHHGKRVGYIASQLLHRLGYSDPQVHFAFELGLLHDCGVSTQQMHSELVNHFDWEDSSIHCRIGHRLLRDFEPLAAFAVPILHHHTRWSELPREDLSDRDALLSNLIFLSDRVDVMAAAHYQRDILLARDDIVRVMEGYSGEYFDPGLVSAFAGLSRSEAFWISLEDHHITRYTWDMGQFQERRPMHLGQLRQLALIMAYIVDQKSPFTARHSARVGALARLLAERHGLAGASCDKIEIAGYLHDLGKLRIPDNILEKPGPLTQVERSLMNQHSYETYEILRHIGGLEDIARWAAYHHEGLDGGGYPFHPAARELTVEARILAVADVFQALVQDRPYRQGLPLPEVLAILAGLVDSGRLDREIVALATRHAETCHETARGGAEEDGLDPASVAVEAGA